MPVKRKYLSIKSFVLPFGILFLFGCGTSESTKKTEIKVSKTDSLADTISLKDKTNLFPKTSALISTDSIYSFQSDNNGKYGFKNRVGKIIIQPIFEIAYDFYGIYAPVIKNKKHGFVDTSGKFSPLNNFQFVYQISELSNETFLTGNGEGLIAVTDKKNKCGYINYKSEIIIPCQYEKAEKFACGLAAVYKIGKFGFIDKTGKIIIDFKYEKVGFFADNRASVLINNKKGFINKKGELIIKPIYQSAFYFSEGLAHVNTSGDYTNYYYIDTTGKTIIKGLFENASPFKNGKALVQKNGKCIEIDKTGKKLKYLGTNCFEGC